VSDKRFGQALLLYAICLALLLTVGVVVQSISVMIGLLVTLLFIVLLPAVVFVWIKGLPVSVGLRVRPVSPVVAICSLGS